MNRIIAIIMLFTFSLSFGALFSEDFVDGIFESHGENPLLLNMKARKHFINGRLDQAEKLLKENLRINPQNTDSQFLLAAVYTKQKKYSSAKDLFYYLFKESPGRKTYKRMFKLILKRWGNREYLDKYADLFKESPADDTSPNMEIEQKFSGSDELLYESPPEVEFTEEEEEPQQGTMMNFGSKIEMVIEEDE